MSISYFQLNKRISQESDGQWRLKVWVAATADDIPPEIFLHRTSPLLPEASAGTAVLVQTCSYADMLNYPASPGSSAFFRRRYIDITFQSKDRLQALWNSVEADVQTLAEDIETVCADAPVETVTDTGTAFRTTVAKQDNPDGSAYAEITVSVIDGSDKDPAVFLIRKLSTSSTDTELVAVASAADMDQYGSTPEDSGLYRVDSVSFAVASGQYSAVLQQLQDDLDLILQHQITVSSSPDSETVDYTWFGVTKDVEQSGTNYRLKVWVDTADESVPEKLFLHQQLPEVPGFTACPKYVAPCSMADLYNYPEEADAGTSFYRLRQVDRTYESRMQLQTEWETMQAALQQLADDIDATLAATAVEADTDVESLLSFRLAQADGGSGNSAGVAIAASTLDGETGDPYVFLLHNRGTETEPEEEFLAVASPADMAAYSTEIEEPPALCGGPSGGLVLPVPGSGLYRRRSIQFYVGSDKLQTLVQQLQDDLQLNFESQAETQADPDAVTALTFSGEDTDFVFGDPGELM